MFMMCSAYQMILVFLWGNFVKCAQVKWLPDTSFDLPTNFVDGQRPCARQNVQFQQNLVSAVQISASNDIKSLILPRNGEIELDNGAELNFGAETNHEDRETCKEGDVYYMEKLNFTWLQAEVWNSPKFSAATPDAQKVPCYDDDVMFPENSQFSIKLPRETQHVRSIIIKGKSLDDAHFKKFAESWEDPGQSFILNEFLTTGVAIGMEVCQARSGCPCQANVSHVDCSQKMCDPPKCSNPVLPRGNCCPICGGVLEFDIDVNTFNMITFKKRIEGVVYEHGGSDKIIAHVGLLWAGRIQVVMVDKEEYSGLSALATRVLERSVGDVASGFQLSLISGSPSTAFGGGDLAAIALFVTLFVFGALYVYFERLAWTTVPLPRLGFQNANILTRFNNRENSITSLLSSRGSVAFRSSFRNPLFVSKSDAGRAGEEASEAADTARTPEPQDCETSPAF